MSKIAFIEATSLGDAWFQALYKIMTEGRKYLITKGSYEGIHRVGLPITINIQYPGTIPLAPIVPEGIPAPTSESDIEQYASYLITPDKEPKEHYTYGEDLYWQIEWVIKHFKEAKGEKEAYGTNHCYMTVGRPETLYFYDLDIDYSEFITVKDRQFGQIIWERYISNAWNQEPDVKPSSQCLRGIDTWIDEGKLHFWCYFRSWDLWGGFPVNLGGIQLVKEYMAGQIGIEDGPMIVSCKDLHVYEHTWVVALMRIMKDEKILEGR